MGSDTRSTFGVQITEYSMTQRTTEHPHQSSEHQNYPLFRDSRVAGKAEALVGRGVIEDLIRRFGPVLAEIILKWLVAQQTVKGQVPANAAAMGLTDLRHLVAMMLRGNKDEILGYILRELSDGFDAATNALDAGA